jgi:multicomponent Na+:H+ antiporter subunit A
MLNTAKGSFMLVATVLFSLLLAPLGLLAHRAPRPLTGWLLALLPLGYAVVFVSLAGPVLAGQSLREVYPWATGLGVDLSFTLDGLSLLFTLIISGIGVLIVGYSGHYLAGDSGMGRFLLYLLLFMGAMLGLVLAGNVLTMFVFWELTSVTSYLLIGYKHDYPEARRGAQHSLLVTAGGGLALLVGLLMLGQAAGSYEFVDIIANSEQVRNNALYIPATLLIFLGAFTKSAQFPFHFWLPGAMSAPTPASAFLHSATMVKAGIYLLARLHPALGETLLWTATLTIVGGFTFLFASFVAIRQVDIKALLAYSTVAMLGTLTMLLGLGGHYAQEAVVTNILAHALYKSPLFLIAGIIDHETGTRDLRLLGGMRKYLPRTMVICAIALLSMAGIPPLLNFVAKEWLLEGALESPLDPNLRYLVLAVIVASAALTLVAAWRLFKNVFLGSASDEVTTKQPHEPALAMLLCPAVPALLSLLLPLGFLPAVSMLLSPAAAAVAGASLTFELYLWKGFNSAFALSVLAISSGVALALIEGRIANFRSPWPERWRGALFFDSIIDGMLALATRTTRLIQGGRLRRYIANTFLALLVLVGLPFVLYGLNDPRNPLLFPFDSELQLYEILAASLVAIGVVATVTARSRLGAIIAVSLVGAMVSLFFALFSAPDLALTQLLIEVLSTVFLVLVFSVLPARFGTLSSRWVRSRDAIIAIVVGLLMGTIALVSASSQMFPPLAPYFLANSLPAAQGANVVNVILVDFRGFDTLGEITVLFIAAVGIYGLLRMRKPRTRANGRTVAPGHRETPASLKPNLIAEEEIVRDV